jgi:hypothetical protein
MALDVHSWRCGQFEQLTMNASAAPIAAGVNISNLWRFLPENLARC